MAQRLVVRRAARLPAYYGARIRDTARIAAPPAVDEHAIGDDWEQAAVHYFRTYEDRWRGWVTPETYEQISEALEED